MSRTNSDYPLPPLVSAPVTPLTTPGTPTLTGIPVSDADGVSVPKQLMKELPEVTCIVRARIPT